MNSNGGGAYPGFAHQGSAQPPHQGINPAMLASFNRQQQPNQFSGGVSPAQLLNGGGMGGMQNQPMLQQQQQMMMMNGGGGLNPAALSALANGMHSGGGGGGDEPQMQAPQNGMTPQVMQLLGNMGITREQVAQMNPAQRHNAMKSVAMAFRQQQLQQQQMQQQQLQQHFTPDAAAFFDRPGSAMGMGMGGGGGGGGMGMGMMPPPRPGTAQGMAGGRPGTGMGMHQAPNMGGGGMGMNMGMGIGSMNPGMNPRTWWVWAWAVVAPYGDGPRPPSRAASLGGGTSVTKFKSAATNGFQPGKPKARRNSVPASGPSAGMPSSHKRSRTRLRITTTGSPYNSQNGNSRRPTAGQSPASAQWAPRPSCAPPPLPVRRRTASRVRHRQWDSSRSFGPQPVKFPASGTPQRQPSLRVLHHDEAGLRAYGTATAAPRPHGGSQITALTAAALPPFSALMLRRSPPLPRSPIARSVNLNPRDARIGRAARDVAGGDPPVSAEEVADVKRGWEGPRVRGLYREMKTRMGAEFREMVGRGTCRGGRRARLTAEVFDVRYPIGRRRERRAPEGRAKSTPRMRTGRNNSCPSVSSLKWSTTKCGTLLCGIERRWWRTTTRADVPWVITKSIQDQLSDFRAHSANYDGDSWDLAVTEDTLRAGTLEGESAAWWSAWRKRLRTEYGFGHKRRKVEKEDDDMDAADERPMLVEEFTFDQKALHDDMRILIRCAGTRHTHDAAARLIVGSMKLDDQFEWDLDNADASPEGFAAIYARN
ncbi:hypothetical protein B0H13DRAFT_2576547 [Mycena leptocephala]|nr:hypothetical protein B0H13DRAFT_2576547 [Mycena leptocephala]